MSHLYLLQKAALGLQTIESMNSVAVPQVDVEPVFIHDGKIFKLGKEAEKEFLKVSEIQADCMRIAPPGYSLCATVFCKVVRSRQVQRWLLPSPGHLGIFKSIYKRKSALAFRQAAADVLNHFRRHTELTHILSGMALTRLWGNALRPWRERKKLSDLGNPHDARDILDRLFAPVLMPVSM